MKKMRTTFGKGNRRRIVALLSVVLVIALLVFGGVNAAARAGDPAFQPYVAGKYQQDGLYSQAIGDTELSTQIAFNKLFNANTQDVYRYSAVKAFKITSKDITDESRLKITLTNSNKYWNLTPTSAGTTITYEVAKTNETISASSFNNLMSQISVTFDVASGDTEGSGTVSIQAYSDKNMTKVIKTNGYNIYTCAIKYFAYAKGTIDGSASTMQYKNTYSSDASFTDPGYNAEYDTIAPQGQATKLDVTPDDSGNGRITLQMNISSGGHQPLPDGEKEPEYGKKAWIGYQIREQGKNWDSSTMPVYWLKDTTGNRTNTSTMKYTDYNLVQAGSDTFEPQQITENVYKTVRYGIWSTQVYDHTEITGYPQKEIDLYDPAQWGQTFTIPIERLDLNPSATGSELTYGKTYIVRGVIATDENSANVQYTNEASFKYEPISASLKTSSTDGYYLSRPVTVQGAQTDISIALNSTFTDTNAVGRSANGPELKAELYFTPERTTGTYADGTEYDESVWYKVKDRATTKNMSSDTLFNPSWSVPAPRNLREIADDSMLAALTTEQLDASIDGDKCAFKVVVTDLYSNYTTTLYSDNFKIDTTPPAEPTVTAKAPNANGEMVNVALKPLVQGQDPTVVGGSGAQVSLTLTGSENDASGLRSYEYEIYFVATEQAGGLGNNDTAILKAIDGLSSTDPRVTYTPWTSAAKDDDGNYTLSVAQGGYYKISARATDNAGRPSSEKASYFRVDLTPPSQPEVYLAQNAVEPTLDGNKPVWAGTKNSFKYYDRSVYSNADVWLFAYSEPKVGKELTKFEYSTDGGLSWKPMNTAAESFLPDQYITAAKTAKEKPAGRDALWPLNYTTLYMYSQTATPAAGTGEQADHQYQAAVALSRQGLDDYQKIIVRATDGLGNVSAVSEPIEMRTIGSLPTTSASMTHDPIEVAVAVGNTTMSISTITPLLKNAAAQKINIAYMGQTEFEKLVKVNGTVHQCTWDDTHCTGPCNDKNCPYAANPELFKPEDVAVQTGKDADSQSLVWTRYDHTAYNTLYMQNGTLAHSNGKEYLVDNNGTKLTDANADVYRSPTVAYKHNAAYYAVADAQPGGNTASGVALKNGGTINHMVETTLLGYRNNATAPTHTAPDGTTIYTQSRDRVVYMGQVSDKTVKYYKDGVVYEIPADDSSYYNSEATVDSRKHWDRAWNAETEAYDGALFTDPGSGSDSRYYVHAGGISAVLGGQNNIGSWNTNQHKDTYDEAGTWNDYVGQTQKGTDNGQTTYKEVYIAKRIYHVTDISTATDMRKGVNLGNPNSDMSKIAINSYYYSDALDFMLVYNNQPTQKVISYSVDDRDVVPHATDGSGFFFNTTIRQSKNAPHRWLISGYLLYDGNPTTADNVDTAVQNFNTWILKLTDVDLEGWADGVGSNGNGREGIALALGSLNSQAAFITSKSVSAALDSSDTATAFYPASGGKIEAVAFTKHDAKAKSIRHYKLVCEGDWTSVYVYNSNTTEKTPAQLTTTYNASVVNRQAQGDDYMLNRPATTAMTAASAVSDAVDSSKYVAIQWRTKWYADNDTATPVYSDTTHATPEGKITDGSYIYTPRPTVDGEQIGGRDATVHTDSNCYGFGPMGHGRSYGHGCTRDSRVVFSNVDLVAAEAKTLTEVVTEPAWGNGKAKFIANISDDAVDDFDDPVLTSQIQWRINNDNTRYIGWGVTDNQEATVKFLERMMNGSTSAGAGNITTRLNNVASVGFYQNGEMTVSNNGATVSNKTTEQVNAVAKYMTEQYYAEFGYDATDPTKLVKDQVNPTGGLTKGGVYSLDDIDNIQFKVDKYGSSSANVDFPSGRWYMIHDIRGYEQACNNQPDSRSGKFADALDTNLSLPGRYTYYFAPDKNAIANGTLDPTDASCIFDFVVNQRPIASFTARMAIYDASGKEIDDDKDADYKKANEKTNKLIIVNNSYDPDVGTALGRVDSNTYSDMKPVYADSYNNSQFNGVTDASTYGHTPISGIVRTEYRWELLVPDAQNKLHNVYTSAWSTTSPHGKSLRELAGLTASDADTTYDKYSNLHDKAVLTIYQRVTDVSTRRLRVDGQTNKYTYTSSYGDASTKDTYDTDNAATKLTKINSKSYSNHTTSTVAQVNVGSSNAQSTNPPSASISLNRPYVYDTATGTDATVIINRNSLHSQGEPFALEWNYGIGNKADRGALVKDGNNYKIPTTDPTSAYRGLVVLQYVGDSSSTDYKNVLVTGEQIGPASGTKKTSSKGGVWRVPIETIKVLLGSYKDSSSTGLVLQAVESAYGWSASQVAMATAAGTTDTDLTEATKQFITDQSSRTIYFKKDNTAPSLPVVETRTYYYADQTARDANWQSTYDAAKDGGATDPAAKAAADAAYPAYTGESYQASNYLDVGLGYNRITITGSSDNEGDLGGYKYYFYDKDKDGKEYKWYKYTDTGADQGKLVQQSTLAAATVTQSTTDSSKVFEILLNAKSKRNTDKSTDTLNVAIWSFDKQSPANETSLTRIEGIKLSSSKPRPTKIEVKNATNGNVAKVDNTNFNADNANAQESGKADDGTSLNYANSEVTVQFTPATDRFTESTDSTTGATIYTPSTSGTERYVDINGEPDLTATANIQYTVEYYDPSVNNSTDYWTYDQYVARSLDQNLYRHPNDPTERDPISNATVLSFKRDGVYRLTAWVVNGSGTASVKNQVTFRIDTTAPSMPEPGIFNERNAAYTAGSWASTVRFEVSGASDVNPRGYEFTVDGGSKWYPLGNFNNARTLTIPSHNLTDEDGKTIINIMGSNNSADKIDGAINIEGTELYVAVRAKDLAGNVKTSQTTRVRIDNQPPSVVGYTLTPSSSTIEVYSDYVVDLDYDQAIDSSDETRRNKVVTIQKDKDGVDVINETDTDIVVPRNGSVTLKFYPRDDKQLDYVEVDNARVDLETDTSGVPAYTLTDVTSDISVKAYFVDKDSNQASPVRQNMVRGLNTALTAARLTPNPVYLASVNSTEEEDDEPVVVSNDDIEIVGASAGDVTIVKEEDEDDILVSDASVAGTVKWDENSVAAGQPLTVTVALQDQDYSVNQVRFNGAELSMNDVTYNAGSYTFTVTPQEGENTLRVYLVVAGTITIVGELDDDNNQLDLIAGDAEGLSGAEVTWSGKPTALAGRPVQMTVKLPAGYTVDWVRFNGSTLDSDKVINDNGEFKFTVTPVVTDQTFLTNTNSLRIETKHVPNRKVQVTVNDSTIGCSASLDGVDLNAGYYYVPQGTSVNVKLHEDAKGLYKAKRIYVIDDGSKVLVHDAEDGDLDGGTDLAVPIPQFTGEGNINDHIVQILVEFDVASSITGDANDDPSSGIVNAKVNVIVNGKGTVTPGTYTADGDNYKATVNVPYTQDPYTAEYSLGRRFTFTAAPNNRLEKVTLTGVDSEGDPLSVEVGVTQTDTDSAHRTYYYDLVPGVVLGRTDTMTVTFVPQTYRVNLYSNIAAGGTISISTEDGYTAPTLSATQEGIPLIITVSPARAAGYRVKNVTITHGSNSPVSLGAVTSYRLGAVKGDVTVNVTFESRSVSKVETTHSIIATANNVQDSGSGLNTTTGQPYRFCIRPGLATAADNIVNTETENYASWDWRPWQSAYTYLFVDCQEAAGQSRVALKPNAPYTVYVQVKDSVGIESTPEARQIYTQANVPSTLGVYNRNESDNTGTKSVMVEVDANDNPEYTEYLVYYDTDPRMQNQRVANSSVNDGWATLKNNEFEVKGLDPGSRYYFTVVARNMDGVPTDLNNEIVDIMLSPAAPEEGSLYFTEPASPVDPILLKWDELPSDVLQLEFYMDGDYIGEVTKDQDQEFKVADPYKSIADTPVKFGYAFVNTGGAGTIQYAVSQEYYDEIQKAKKDREEKQKEYEDAFEAATEEEQAEMPAFDNKLETYYTEKLKAMLEVAGEENSQLFNQCLPYPRFPLSIGTESEYRESITASESTGSINLAMRYDPAIMRYQEYDLYLKAYEVSGTVEEGNLTYTEVPITEWNPGRQYWATDDNGDILYEDLLDENGQKVPQQKVVTTTVRSDRGIYRARAAWSNLNTNLEYKVFVKEIRTTPTSSVSDIVGSSEQVEGYGVVGLLQKSCFVNEENFGYKYLGTAAETAMLTVPESEEGAGDGVVGTWDTAKISNYTLGLGWDSPINTSRYISFNKSPQIQLATDDPYDSSVNEGKIKTDVDGGTFILTDANEDSDEKFRLKAWVYDPDGPGGNGDIRIEGFVAESSSGKALTGTVKSTKDGSAGLAADYLMPASEDAAKGSPVYLEFDTASLNSSVLYPYLKLAAYDGVTETVNEDAEGFRLVVNHETPTTTVSTAHVDAKTGYQLVQAGKSYSWEEFIQTNAKLSDTVLPNQVALSKVAMLVMPDNYQKTFGYNSYKRLKTALMGDDNGNGIDSAAVTKAVQLLKGFGVTFTEDNGVPQTAFYTRSTATWQLMKDGKLTEDGLTLALLNVQPDITKYVSITKDQYDANVGNYAAYFRKEAGATEDDSTYWVDVKFAVLDHPELELCDWLESDGAGGIKPKFVTDNSGKELKDADSNYHRLRIVANFGGNSSYTPVECVVKDEPSAVVVSQQHFGWSTASQGEYNYFRTDPDHSGGITVGDMYQRYVVEREAFTGTPELVNGQAPTADTKTPAFRIWDTVNEVEVTPANLETYELQEGEDYQVYKVWDDYGLVDNSRISVQLKVDLGIYPRFTQAGIVMTTENTLTAAKAVAEADRAYVAGSGSANVYVTKSDNYSVAQEGLTANQTYYLWSFFQTPDMEEPEFSEQYVALTTADDYATANYGFNVLTEELYEEDYYGNGASGLDRSYRVDVMGSLKAWGPIEFSIQYYLADEFGNLAKVDPDNSEKLIPLEEGEDPVELTGDQLTWAAETFRFSASDDAEKAGAVFPDPTDLTKVIYKFTSGTTKYIYLHMTDTDKEQGHMIARVTMKKTSAAGLTGYEPQNYTMITNGLGSMDIFVRDDESPRTEYKIGVVNPEKGSTYYLAREKDTDPYSYSLPGLKVDYGGTGDLVVTYKNTGTGNLDRITATVYADYNGRMQDTVSEYFRADTPRVQNLLISEPNSVGTVRVQPVRDLSDGIYTGWLVITADNVENDDRIVIKLEQVVGQTTLQGRIYITETAPMPGVNVGVSTVKVYDYSKYGDGSNLEDALVYSTDTNPDGTYEIPNILNGKRYQIRVERPGFLSYDSTNKAVIVLNLSKLTVNQGATRTLSFGLRGGDLDGDDDIDSVDQGILVSHYNKFVDQYVDTTKPYSEWTVEQKQIYICDFNGDGVINALDRAYQYINSTYTSSDYDYYQLKE